MHRRTILFFLFVICFFCPVLSGCGSREPISQSGFYFDTVISVTLYDPSKTEELEHCFALADQYEKYFSAKLPDSDISRINDAGQKPVSVHEETLDLLQKGLFYAELSGGRFDITIGKLTELWDFQSDDPVLPDIETAAEAAEAVDFHKVRINGNMVSLTDSSISLDLGGIAKGYIADQMKAYLLSEGIESGLINLGGNLLTIGEKEDGSAYTVGIQKPFDETGAIIASVQIKDQTVVTSGTYERCFELNGRLYHHILDTKTGYPLDNGLNSVTILCDNSADGDGLSTTCFALGLEKGMELIESLEDTEAVFITADNQLHTSSGIGTKIPLKEIS